MRKLLLVASVLLLCGCSTYKYQLGAPPNNKGYVVTRDNKVISEYTVGKDKSLPDKKIAEKRFKRRRGKVEDYYKKMGYMESRVKEVFLDPPIAFFKVIFGFFRLPFIAVSDYKYDHDPAYREKIKKIEEQKDALEQARIDKLRVDLVAYIQLDLSSKEKNLPLQEVPFVPEPVSAPIMEKPVIEQAVPALPVQKEVSVKVQAAILPATPAVSEAPVLPTLTPPVVVSVQQEKVLLAQEEEVKEITLPTPKSRVVSKKKTELVAIIVANPAKGFSPLTVKFSGAKSYSRGSKIVSYSWDFGDGDTSTKPNPVNTYYSGSFMPQVFNVTLTIQDRLGNTATTTSVVEVMNK